MKCTKYNELLSKLEEATLTTGETKEMQIHAQSCSVCNESFSAIQKYKAYVAVLKNNKPVLENKHGFINELIDLLPEREQGQKTIEKFAFVKTIYFVKTSLTGIAAGLLVLVALQIGTDAWNIRQLENRMQAMQSQIRYKPFQKGLLSLLEARVNDQATSPLSKAKAGLRKQIVFKYQFKNQLIPNYISQSPNNFGMY
jgi:hypothetical protein